MVLTWKAEGKSGMSKWIPHKWMVEKCGFTRDERWSTPATFPNLDPSCLLDVLGPDLGNERIDDN